MTLQRDEERYATLVRLIGSLSRLYSDNTSPYIDSRFVERLFTLTTGSQDLGRRDISFDAIHGAMGVGVKTFLSGKGNKKREKIAEFTAHGRAGRFDNLDYKELVYEVAKARNERVASDANEIGADLSQSIYHCLIRVPGGAIVHEEPYGLIDIDGLKPTDARGNVLKTWKRTGRGVYFTDGKNYYSYSVPKTVLFKRFDFNRKKNFIPIEIKEDPLIDLLSMFSPAESKKSAHVLAGLDLAISVPTNTPQILLKEDEDMVPGKDFVILPLYSTKGGEFVVPTKSGVNQWNAAGRARKLGEAYIQIPSRIHRLYPGFFPDRDSPFDLVLPNQSKPVVAKVCQQGSKALMTSPNHHLGQWLIGVLNPNIETWQFEEAPVGVSPLEYRDLLRIGKDSVRVTRVKTKGKFSYAIEFAPIGSYEDFIESSK